MKKSVSIGGLFGDAAPSGGPVTPSTTPPGVTVQEAARRLRQQVLDVVSETSFRAGERRERQARDAALAAGRRKGNAAQANNSAKAKMFAHDANEKLLAHPQLLPHAVRHRAHEAIVRAQYIVERMGVEGIKQANGKPYSARTVYDWITREPRP